MRAFHAVTARSVSVQTRRTTVGQAGSQEEGVVKEALLAGGAGSLPAASSKYTGEACFFLVNKRFLL